MSKKIGIVGCGWLGQPLSLELSKNYKVECFSRQNTTDISSFWQSDIIIITINTKDNYLQTLKKIAQLTKKTSSIILMSSISVYREFNEEIDESAKITKTALQREAEELIQSLRDKVLILRLGGLMGDDRVAGRWKTASTFSDGVVNYIHKDDVINITKKMIESNITDGIYNLVAPTYPLRSEVHKKNREAIGLELGKFNGITYRKVLSDTLVKKINYTFLHPNPLNFWD